jgi:cell division protein FtsB
MASDDGNLPDRRDIEALRSELEASLLEANSLKAALTLARSSLDEKDAENLDLKRQLARAKDEHFVMKQQISSLRARNREAVAEMARLEIGLEQEDERAFNYAVARQSVSSVSDDAASGFASPLRRSLTSAASSGSIASLANNSGTSCGYRRTTSVSSGSHVAAMLPQFRVRPRTPSSVTDSSRRSDRACSVDDLMTEARFDALEKWRTISYYDDDGCPVSQRSPVPMLPDSWDESGAMVRPRSAMGVGGGSRCGGRDSRVSRANSSVSSCSSAWPLTPRAHGGQR